MLAYRICFLLIRCLPLFLSPCRHAIGPQILRKEGIECLDGELLLVKLQNARCEGLYGKVRARYCRGALVEGKLGVPAKLDAKVAAQESLPVCCREQLLGSREVVRSNGVLDFVAPQTDSSNVKLATAAMVDDGKKYRVITR